MNILCPIREQAAKSPDHFALTDSDRTMTYEELDAGVSGVVEFLKSRGIDAGDVVAFSGRNSVEQVLVFFASLRLGSVFMPLNFRSTASDRNDQMKETGARLLIHDAEFEVKAPGCDKLEADVIDPLINEIAHEDAHCDLAREAVIVFTSGSAGRPKGVVLTGSNIYYSAAGANGALHLADNDRWLAVLPFFHVGGLSIIYRTALAGAGSYISGGFEVAQILNSVKPGEVNIISVVPAMLAELINADLDNVLKNLKAIILGGAAGGAGLMNEITKRQLPVMTTYGMTETSSMVTLASPDNVFENSRTSGNLLPHRELKIVADDGSLLPSGETGRIMVGGKVLSSRYVGEQSEKKHSVDHWFATGDIGYRDESGQLYVLGRSDRVIISGGENIDLDRIEQTINSLKGVSDAAVLSRRDKKWGQRPVAFVVCHGDLHDEDGIRSILGRQLAAMMIPDRIIFVPEIPLTGSGKYDRVLLRKNYSDVFSGD